MKIALEITGISFKRTAGKAKKAVATVVNAVKTKKLALVEKPVKKSKSKK